MYLNNFPQLLFQIKGKYPKMLVSASEIAPVALHSPQTNSRVVAGENLTSSASVVVMSKGQSDVPGSHIGQHSPLISYSALLQVATQSTVFMMRRGSSVDRR